MNLQQIACLQLHVVIVRVAKMPRGENEALNAADNPCRQKQTNAERAGGIVV